jgi:adenine-specific DNA-methyltransferase
MPKKSTNKETIKSVDAIRHTDDKRKNIPTIEYRPMVSDDQQSPVPVKYPRNTDLDPQLVWRGKDEQDWSDLVVHAPPLYIQEKVHPKVLIDDLIRMAGDRESAKASDKKSSGQVQYTQLSLFDDFNGVPDGDAKTEFYQHDQHWSNRMILGDSLQVMASLAEREGLRGKVQCIYFDPPYGIKFNSNFQWSTTSRDVKDGNASHITREPEQVKAFRDTWRDGIHSYLTYLRDRLTVARDLLTDSGSIFVQIGDENVHRVRGVLDEILGADNFVSQIHYTTTSGLTSGALSRAGDYVLWYAKSLNTLKYRQLYSGKLDPIEDGKSKYDQLEDEYMQRRGFSRSEKQFHGLPIGSRLFRFGAIDSQEPPPVSTPLDFEGNVYFPTNGRHWTASYPIGMQRLNQANRIGIQGRKLAYIRYFDDFNIRPLHNLWIDVGGTVQSRSDPKIYVVQTGTAVIQRCILMATDPGDLVLDPTCGSGTSAMVAEQWGRRWITIDTSRVALALARARIMGARYPYYLLADSKEGQVKEAEVTRTAASTKPVQNNIRMGFVYERVPHITLKSIANNAEIDVIWDKWEEKILPIREELGKKSGDWKDAKNKSRTPEEWEIPREPDPKSSLVTTHQALLASFWQARIARQKEIDASIAAKAEFEYLYDKPYEDKKKVRVAGPFTVESLSPHRMLGIDENDELMDIGRGSVASGKGGYDKPQDFPTMILENLRAAGVQQAHKDGRIEFTSLVAWPGELVCAEGTYQSDPATDPTNQPSTNPQPSSANNSSTPAAHSSKRAAIFIGPEFGTVQRQDLVLAAREASDAGFDVLIACAFNFDAMSTEFNKLGRIPVLKARMNADLHMADDLKNTGKGNLFVIFGEPDVELLQEGFGSMRVKVNGVDVFHPNTGEVRSDGPEGIACWFIDTDYNEESFFVRHAYFLGQNDPYTALKTTLKAEIDADAWSSLNSAISRPFPRPLSGRIAVKVINHLGDEVMKVFRV